MSSSAKWASWRWPCRAPGCAPSGPCQLPPRGLADLTGAQERLPGGWTETWAFPSWPPSSVTTGPAAVPASARPGLWGCAWHSGSLASCAATHLPAYEHMTPELSPAPPGPCRSVRDICVWTESLQGSGTRDQLLPGTRLGRRMGRPAVQSWAAPPEEGVPDSRGAQPWLPLPHPGVPSSVLSLLLMGEAQVPALPTAPLLLRPLAPPPPPHPRQLEAVPGSQAS